MRIALSLVAVAACAHPMPAPAPSPSPPAPRADCAAAGAAGAEALREMIASASQRDEVSATIATRCRDDRWSDDARTCVAAATSHDAAHACLERLTPAQHESIGRAISTLLHPPQAQPTLTGIEPARGDADGGTYVRLTGAHFLDGGTRDAKVYFGARQGEVVRFASDGELIVQAPGGKDGQRVDVLVFFAPGGEQKLRDAFEFVERPVQDWGECSGSPALIASCLDYQGTAELVAGHARLASAKLREAVARVPEATYYLHLCEALTADAKPGAARSACEAALKQHPTPNVRAQIEEALAKIVVQ